MSALKQEPSPSWDSAAEVHVPGHHPMAGCAGFHKAGGSGGVGSPRAGCPQRCRRWQCGQQQRGRSLAPLSPAASWGEHKASLGKQVRQQSQSRVLTGLFGGMVLAQDERGPESHHQNHKRKKRQPGIKLALPRDGDSAQWPGRGQVRRCVSASPGKS